MNGESPIQAQLRSLSIPRGQRPAGRTVESPTRRYLLIGGIVVLVAVGAYLLRGVLSGRADSSRANAGDAVPLLSVSLNDQSQGAPVLTATGKIVSDHQVKVATKVSGQVVALFFEQGDRIEKGQRLAELEDNIYRARRDEAAALAAKAKATAAFESVNFGRVERLYNDQQAPEIEYAEARRKLDEAKAQVEASEAILAAAQKTLGDCEVVAPIAGVVLERNVEVGDFVAAEGGLGAMANSQFAVIADLEKLRVEIDVSELDIARLRRDMPCAIIPDAHKDRRYAGRVMWVDPGANYAKATVQVKVRIEDPDEFLRIEGAAQVQFLDAADKPVGGSTGASPSRSIWIPIAACKPDPDWKTASVMLVDEGRFREATITLGRRDATRVEVLGGLSEGQRIAAEVDAAEDGERVRS